MRPDPAKSCGPYHLPEQRLPGLAEAHSTASSAQRPPDDVSDAEAAVLAGAGSDGVSAEDSGRISRRADDRSADPGPVHDEGPWQQRSATSQWLLPLGRDIDTSLGVLSTERQQAASVGGGEAVPAAAGLQAGAGAAAGSGAAAPRRLPRTDELNHDTIAMVALDAKGRIAAGASSNGANHKVR